MYSFLILLLLVFLLGMYSWNRAIKETWLADYMNYPLCRCGKYMPLDNGYERELEKKSVWFDA